MCWLQGYLLGYDWEAKALRSKADNSGYLIYDTPEDDIHPRA